jgi:hypothetical protein
MVAYKGWQMDRIGFPLYDFLTNIEINDWFEYGFIFISVMFVVTRVFKPTFIHVIGIIAAVLLIYYRIDERRSTLSNINDELDFRLKTLYPEPQNLHMDADLVNIFHNIKEMRDYNSEAYDNALIAVDNMLKIESEIEAGVYHCAENLDLVIDQMYKALNQMASMIIKTPIPKALTLKYMKTMKALHIILRRHVDDCYNLCKKEYARRPIDINTKFIYNDGPRPNDTDNLDYNPHYNIY